MTCGLDRCGNNQRARGRYLGGKVPFGYRVGENGALIEHEAEQEAIRAMIAMRKQGMALRPIAAAMAERGFRIGHEAVKHAVAARDHRLQSTGHRWRGSERRLPRSSWPS
jgi:hypothetical protein